MSPAVGWNEDGALTVAVYGDIAEAANWVGDRVGGRGWG